MAPPISLDAYKVNAELVADEILRKLRLVNFARRSLATESGRIPRPNAPRH